MITIDTVFILGAGASFPYGYPTGYQLTEKICTNQSYFTSIHPQEKRALDNLIQRFKGSGNSSIDLFLSRNPSYADIGKKLILFYLFHAEQHSKFGLDMSHDLRNQDWHSYLFEKMTRSLSSEDGYKMFGKNRVKFISFNYDRSIEYLFHKRLRNSFTTASDDEITNCVNNIDIHHVYGTLSAPPWIDGGLDFLNEESTITRVSYDGLERNNFIHRFDNLIGNIRVVHDRTQSDIETVIEWINKSKRIFFLGFGYAQENLKALKIHDNIRSSHMVYGTAKDFEKNEIENIKGELSKLWSTEYPENSTLHIDNTDCKTLLRRYL